MVWVFMGDSDEEGSENMVIRQLGFWIGTHVAGAVAADRMMTAKGFQCC